MLTVFVNMLCKHSAKDFTVVFHNYVDVVSYLNENTNMR